MPKPPKSCEQTLKKLSLKALRLMSGRFCMGERCVCMKIIKEGKKPNMTKRFECKGCCCIFEADEGEWFNTDKDYNDPRPSANCPFCGDDKRVFEQVMRR